MLEAQQFLKDPLLLDGRKFHIRLYVLVTGYNPLRAYIHRNARVLVAEQK